MKYSSITKAVFINRPNRFIANVLIDSRVETVHVKNTVRCKEILVEGIPVILEASKNNERKTGYSLIAAYKKDTLINIDSQVPNTVVHDAIKEGILTEFPCVNHIRREVTFGNSRFDIYYETDKSKGFIEVKGVTLEENGAAMFPDAPTERGAKHVYEMMKAVETGYQGNIIFLIQMKGIRYFTPNIKTDPAFTEALKTAEKSGVRILAYDSVVTEGSIEIGEQIKVVL